jgi:HEAT repeat protein
VRAALCGAAGNDPNPGVRLKAIEALRGYGRDAQVQQVLLDALDHDDNSGVRVEAVNALSAALESSSDGAAANGASQAAQDPRVEQVLRRSSQNDSNRYVRMTAAATLQQIDSNQPAFASAAP